MPAAKKRSGAQVTILVLLWLAVIATGAAGRTALLLSRRGAVAGRLQGVAGSHSDTGVPVGVRAWPRVAPPARVEAVLADAALPIESAVAWTGWLGLVAAGPLVALVVSGAGLAAVVLFAVACGPVLAVRARRGGADARLEQAIPATLEAVARSLRSGASLRQAVEEVGDTSKAAANSKRRGTVLSAELARAAAEAAHGASLVSALEGVAARRPIPGVRLGVAALCLGAETGGAQARAVDGVAATVRERLAVIAELRALASQARISALVIGLAPIGFGGFAAATDPRTAQFMLHTPAGLAMLSVGLTLDGLGWLWMQRLAKVSS